VSGRANVADGKCGRTSSNMVGSSLADEVVEENGRTYHVYKDGSEFFHKKKCVGGRADERE
jgi:hypothetical protein